MYRLTMDTNQLEKYFYLLIVKHYNNFSSFVYLCTHFLQFLSANNWNVLCLVCYLSLLIHYDRIIDIKVCYYGCYQWPHNCCIDDCCDVRQDVEYFCHCTLLLSFSFITINVQLLSLFVGGLLNNIIEQIYSTFLAITRAIALSIIPGQARIVVAKIRVHMDKM